METFATDEPLDAVAPLLEFDDPVELLDDFLSLEQPDSPTTTIAVAAAATVTQRFTRYSLLRLRRVANEVPFRQYATLLKPRIAL